MKRKMFVVMLIMTMLCACNSTEVSQKETVILSESTDIEILEEINQFDYNIYDNQALNIGSIELFSDITETNIYNYSEQVKGAYTPRFVEDGIIPAHLLSILEEALYNTTNISTRNFMDDILNSPYFDTLRSLGADEYLLNLEEVYQLFPEVYEHEEEIENIDQSYRFIDNRENCLAIFHLSEGDSNEKLYVFTYRSGGSNGVNSVSITKENNGEFVDLCEFETQNNGYGRVIKYEESFYYVFLEYNYNLKNYDGIRIHKLGNDADTENILIKYLPEKYIWKNIFENQIESRENINSYIESIRETISSEQYIESGNVEEVQLFWGDEKLDTSFPLADEYNQYHNIDLTNSDTPIYIRKSDYVPSNYQGTWHLRTKFYIYDIQTDAIVELEKLEIGEQLPLKNELVQMWFKVIDDRVFTFTIYHISDYNYMLNVLLIEGGEITVIRTDIFSPQRKFVLTGGNVFRSY
ncbi:hypothetical protein LJC58_05230 [Lachnospiraceae bacterium OttesenSCG-928-D06]|nr:hypothetical protein [Lachnospiraceae bacterium OttesenSCG-928-D06]